MAEPILGQSKRTGKGGNSFSKIKKLIMAILLCGGAVLLCSSKQNILGFINMKPKNADLQSQYSSVDVPTRDADIVGMIVSVSGNEVTVLEVDPSNVPQKQNESSKQSTSKNAISLGQTNSGMPAGGPPGAGFSRSSSSRSSSSSSSKSSSSGSSSSSGNRQTIMSEIKAGSTGKETITVPIGIPILKITGAGNGGEAQETSSFVDLTSDTLVKVWLKKTDDGKNVAEFVDITGKANMGNSNN